MSILVISRNNSVKSEIKDFNKLSDLIKHKLTEIGQERKKIQVDFNNKIDQKLPTGKYNLIIISEDIKIKITIVDLCNLYFGLSDTGVLGFSHESGGKKILTSNMQWAAGKFEIDTLTTMDNIFEPSTPYESRGTYIVSYSKQTNNDIFPYLINWVCRSKNLRVFGKRIMESLPYMTTEIIHSFHVIALFCIENKTKSFVPEDSEDKADIIIEAINTFFEEELPDQPPTPEPTHTHARGLKWSKNSCYMDSILQCLFRVPSVTSKHILNFDLSKFPGKHCISDNKEDLKLRQDIQKELLKITNFIRGYNQRDQRNLTVTKLRQLIKKCVNTRQAFWGSAQQDAGEFLTWLFAIFPSQGGLTRQESWYTNYAIGSTNIKVEESNNRFLPLVSNVWHVSRYVIINQEEEGKSSTPIEEFLKIKNEGSTEFTEEIWNDAGELVMEAKGVNKHANGNSYSRVITQNSVIDANGSFIFSIDRGGSGIGNDGYQKNLKKLTYQIIPTDIIQFSSYSRKLKGTGEDAEIFLRDNSSTPKDFKFSGVIIHDGGSGGGHYVCYYRDNNDWYFYDDYNNPMPRKVASSYQEFIKKFSSIKRTGTLYFYNEIELSGIWWKDQELDLN